MILPHVAACRQVLRVPSRMVALCSGKASGMHTNPVEFLVRFGFHWITECYAARLLCAVLSINTHRLRFLSGT